MSTPEDLVRDRLASQEMDSLSGLLVEVESFVRRFVVLSDEQAVAVALWVVHVHAFVAASTTPYLSVSSAAPRSGKSRLLEVIDALLGEDRALFTMNVSPAALYRVIDSRPGTAVLIDESDRVMNGNRERAEELAGLINSGFRRRGGYAVRTVGQGANLTPQRFRTFCPKVIAGLGQLPDTVADRSIPIRMHRRLRSETCERFREPDAAGAAPIREALERWATPETLATLATAQPALPEILNDRAQDGWEPLLAIADLADGGWPAMARAAAAALQAGNADATDEALELLALRHVRNAFEESGQRKLPTAAILRALVHRDDGPWAEWWARAVEEGKELPAARRLGRLLKPFGAEPKSLRLTGGSVRRGYDRKDLEDAWARYVPVGTATPETTATPLARHVAEVAGVAVLPEVQHA
jgi:hypothetical protein